MQAGRDIAHFQRLDSVETIFDPVDLGSLKSELKPENSLHAALYQKLNIYIWRNAISLHASPSALLWFFVNTMILNLKYLSDEFNSRQNRLKVIHAERTAVGIQLVQMGDFSEKSSRAAWHDMIAVISGYEQPTSKLVYQTIPLLHKSVIN